ncbi:MULTISPECIES: D-mannonate oxidoreductase [unclassified Acidocella]|uniref:mannitol dehydrogenase family protein n=1 Tax=unclassified Acidocella TaxID=2648610 RepID=UPI00028D99F2|nr:MULTISPECIES: D-mannonate oxidoreductase [unclassified Acidocella]EKN01351.1 altronate dehydrogenase [Acidocella sp. MX-AZ02]WBO60863.1 mannitol dehydrogenase family protein [Acidocella sp. MX-AZ03]
MSITPILQFGTSRFLQAHADLFISEALAHGQALGPVSVVQSSGNPDRAERLSALANGYVVRIQGVRNGAQVSHETHVNAITRALDTRTQWPEICAIAAQEAQIILSNTGDSGWVPKPEDDAPGFHQAMSYPAKLTHLLNARFQAGGQRLQIMPTELITRNGERLREHVLARAERLSASFAAWVASEVLFVNSLVDRIVSAPLEPAGAVAEPYALWAIEECDGLILPCTHPAIQLVDSLARIEKLKLHILNLGHSYMAAGWLARGGGTEETVRDVMENEVLRADIADLYAREVLPVFAAAGYREEAEPYAAATLERFANPFLAHRLSDIATHHTEKLQRRIGAFLDWAASLQTNIAQPRLRTAMAGIKCN